MRALVISGGGSKGAFAGGITQYLLEEEKQSYDLFLGTSTGSLLVSHLALNKIETLKESYTQVNQSSIFSSNPFLVVNRKGEERIKINHMNVLMNFIRGSKTFGESHNLRKLIEQQISLKDFHALQKMIYLLVPNLFDSHARNHQSFLKLYTYEDAPLNLCLLQFSYHLKQLKNLSFYSF